MLSTITIKKGTRAQIEAAKLSGELFEGEPYLITDEKRIGVGLGPDSYSAFALEKPRVLVEASAPTLIPNLNTFDAFEFTGLSENLSISAPIGTLYDFHRLLFRIKDNGTSRSLTWNSIFISGGVILPVGTTVGKTSHIGFIWSAAISKWMCVASLTEE